MKPTEFIDFLIGDATPEERLRLARITFRVIVSIHIMWACGLLAPLGLTGFVFADEVDSKIQQAVEPVNRKLSAIESKLERNEDIQKRILTAQIAAQLRDLNRLRCSTADEHVRLRMERDIEEAEMEYKTLTGERYPLASCDNL